MAGFDDPSLYGERWAEVYDDWWGTGPDDACLALLAELAGGGPVLELGIGTGRVALPLAARGVDVRGIDSAPAMVERLRSKPGGDAIPVAVGDFADVDVRGSDAGADVGEGFAVVFVVFNTFFALLTQDDQVRCFANVAAGLRPGGVFVIDAFVPDTSRFELDQAVAARSVGPDQVHLDVSRHDPTAQVVHTQRVVLSDGGVRLYPVAIRYAWPSELDLMARLAGLTLEARWSTWDRQPFTAMSARHVSVWRK